MLASRFQEYLDKQFSKLPKTKEVSDFKAELYDNLMSRSLDLSMEGMSEDEIYENCIKSLGDYSDNLKALDRNPINIVRDRRFIKTVLFTMAFVLTVSVAYLIISLFTQQWGLCAMIMFPAMGVLMYVAATAFILNRNIGLKKNGTSGIIIFSYMAIAALIIFFVFGFGIKYLPSVSGGTVRTVTRAWAVFGTLPALAGLSSMITFKFLRKKRIPSVVIFFEIIFIGVAAYLITAAVLWQFHPYWLIVVVAAVVAFIYMIFKIASKLKTK